MTRLEKQQEKHNCLWKHGDTLENGNCHRKKIGGGSFATYEFIIWRESTSTSWLTRYHMAAPVDSQTYSAPLSPHLMAAGSWEHRDLTQGFDHGDLTNEIWLVLNQAWKNSDVRHQKRGYTPFLFGQPIMRRWWTFGWNCVSQTKPNYSCCTLDEWNHRWPRVSFRSYAIWEKWFTLPFGEYPFKSGR